MLSEEEMSGWQHEVTAVPATDWGCPSACVICVFKHTYCFNVQQQPLNHEKLNN